MKHFTSILIIFIPVFLLVHSSCTNLQLDILEQRIEDNFNGSLIPPGDIDPTGINNFSFAVIGDTHVGSPGGGIVAPMVQMIQQRGDAFVVATGDITNTGKEGQFKSFKSVFANAGFSNLFRVAIGNHDIFFNGWQDYKREIGKSIFTFSADNVFFVFLDSASGILGQDQLEWLDSVLQGSSHPHKIVVTHFPVFDGHFGGMFRLNSDEEISILKTILYKHSVDYMFSGHYHGYKSILIGRTQYIVTGGANDLQDIGEEQHFVRVHVNGDNISSEVVPFP